jgi:hypothetical protein
MVKPRHEQEIIYAIKTMKANKAPGEDRIPADMLKTEPTACARKLGLFNKECENVPEQWTRGIIAEIPQKKDLSSCVD